jgi:hypothetical protein
LLSVVSPEQLRRLLAEPPRRGTRSCLRSGSRGLFSKRHRGTIRSSSRWGGVAATVDYEPGVVDVRVVRRELELAGTDLDSSVNPPSSWRTLER